MLHRTLTTADGIHILQAYEYADAAARTGASGFLPADVGKVARQLDNNSFWVLISDSPVTWQGISGSGTLVPHATTHKGDGSDPIAVVTTTVAGLMSGADKTKLDGLPSTVPTGSLWFGAGSVGLTTTSRYLLPGYTPNLASISRAALRASRSGVLRNLRVQHNAVGVGGLVTYTVWINGVSTTLQVSVLASAAGGSDTTHTPAVAADDLVEIQVTKGALISTSPGVVVASVEYG